MRTIRRRRLGQMIGHNPVTEGEREWLRLCSAVYRGRMDKNEEPAAPITEETADSGHGGIEIPESATVEEYDAWCETLPSVVPDIDPRLLERVKTSIRLSRKVIDGFNYLAEQKGLRSGQTLMKIVLENYLAKSLPPDF